MAFKYLFVSVLLFAAQNAPAFGQDPAPPGPPAPGNTAAAPPTTAADSGNTDDDMPNMECSQPGYMCSDCNNQAVCIGDGLGGFKQIKNRCSPNSHCMNGVCTAGNKCYYREFKCTDDGFFPDPYDCTKYHVCMYDAPTKNYKGLDMSCGDGRGSYDAASGTCGFPMNSTACTLGPVPQCISALQLGVLVSDPSIYYLCTEDEKTCAPELYKCAGGKTFDTKKVSCVAAKSKKA